MNRESGVESPEWRAQRGESRPSPPRPRPSTHNRDGFTLIEMMIALAVLAFTLATLVSTQASTVRMLALADQMNVASMLVRGKMQEIEEGLREDGFQIGIVTDYGDFSDDGYDDFEWQAEIEPVEISDDAEDQFVANIHAELFGEGTTGEGSLSGSAAVSQYLPMIIGQVPQFINQVGERTRLIRLTLSFDSLLGEQTLSVTEYFTLLELPQPVLELPGGLGDLPGGTGGLLGSPGEGGGDGQGDGDPNRQGGGE